MNQLIIHSRFIIFRMHSLILKYFNLYYFLIIIISINYFYFYLFILMLIYKNCLRKLSIIVIS